MVDGWWTLDGLADFFAEVVVPGALFIVGAFVILIAIATFSYLAHVLRKPDDVETPGRGS